MLNFMRPPKDRRDPSLRKQEDPSQHYDSYDPYVGREPNSGYQKRQDPYIHSYDRRDAPYESPRPEEPFEPQMRGPIRERPTQAHQDPRRFEREREYDGYEAAPPLYANRSQDARYHTSYEQNPYGGQDRLGSGSSNRQRSARNQDLKTLGFWEEEDEEQPREEWQEGNALIRFIVVIVGVIFLSAAAWFCYKWVQSSQDDKIPVIRPEEGMIRHRPKDPGGVQVPHTDKLIYDRFSPQTGNGEEEERILAAPEDYGQEETAQDQPYSPPQGPQGSYPPQQGQPQYAPPPPQHGGYPQGYAQQPYTAPPPAAHQQGAPPPVQQGGYPHQAQQPPYQGQYAQPYPPAPLYPQAHQGQGVPAAAPLQAPASQERETVSRVADEASAQEEAGDGVYILMATLPSRAQAERESQRLKRRYNQDLSDYDIEVRRSSDGKFIVVAGPFSKRTEALSVSSRLGRGARVLG